MSVLFFGAKELANVAGAVRGTQIMPAEAAGILSRYSEANLNCFQAAYGRRPEARKILARKTPVTAEAILAALDEQPDLDRAVDTYGHLEFNMQDNQGRGFVTTDLIQDLIGLGDALRTAVRRQTLAA